MEVSSRMLEVGCGGIARVHENEGRVLAGAINIYPYEENSSSNVSAPLVRSSKTNKSVRTISALWPVGHSRASRILVNSVLIFNIIKKQSSKSSKISIKKKRP